MKELKNEQEKGEDRLSSGTGCRGRKERRTEGRKERRKKRKSRSHFGRPLHRGLSPPATFSSRATRLPECKGKTELAGAVRLDSVFSTYYQSRSTDTRVDWGDTSDKVAAHAR